MANSSLAAPAAPRLDFAAAQPAIYRAQLQLGQAAGDAFKASGLPEGLFDLVQLRASQINSCAFCLDMHSKDARHAGEREDRLHLLNAWREAPHYTDVERAALSLTEALTLVSIDQVPDEVWNAAASVLKEDQLAAVIGAVITINGWNRIAIATRMTPGEYQPT
jgi:AhpD family alkylhydroperoxidase